MALPVLVLPTPVGIGNVLAPSLMSVAFGQISVGLVAGTVAIAASVVGWLCIGGWLAGLLEAEAARMIARDEDVVAMTRLGRVRELSDRDGVRLDVALGRGARGGADPRRAADRVRAARRRSRVGFRPGRAWSRTGS